MTLQKGLYILNCGHTIELIDQKLVNAKACPKGSWRGRFIDCGEDRHLKNRTYRWDKNGKLFWPKADKEKKEQEALSIKEQA